MLELKGEEERKMRGTDIETKKDVVIVISPRGKIKGSR
jgi:hypothetical protein